MKTLLAVACIALFFYLKRKRAHALAAIPFPLLHILPPVKSVQLILAHLGRTAFTISLLLLFIAFVNPFNTSFLKSVSDTSTTAEVAIEPKSGLGIYLVIDKSSSMKAASTVQDIQGTPLTKIDWVKQLADQLIRARENDTIGLVTFARVATIVSPLTLDHTALKGKIQQIEPVAYQNEDGTAIGYALYKTANLIVSTNYFTQRQKERKKPAYQTKNEVIIIFTDGLQSPHPDDRTSAYRFISLEDALTFAKDNGIRVFYIGVDPILKKQQFSEDIKNIQNYTTQTGGSFFLINSEENTQELLHRLRQLAPEELPENEIGELRELYREHSPQEPIQRNIVVIALIFFAFAVCTETLFARTLP